MSIQSQSGSAILTRGRKPLLLTRSGGGVAGVTDPHERRRVSEEDRFTRRRYDEFRSAAEYVSAAFAAVPAVMRVALFGSVASPPRVAAKGRWRGRIHEPKDVDLAVWLDALPNLDQLRVLRARCASAVA